MYEIEKKINLNNITEKEIIVMWTNGFNIKQISKHYAKSEKKRGNKITQLQAQQIIEPMIFKYQTNLMK